MELLMSIQSVVAHHQYEDRDTSFARDVLDGLAARPKRLSPKYFYDETGSRLFEEITALPEYYPTRCELAILHPHAPHVAPPFPPAPPLVSFSTASPSKPP